MTPTPKRQVKLKYSRVVFTIEAEAHGYWFVSYPNPTGAVAGPLCTVIPSKLQDGYEEVPRTPAQGDWWEDAQGAVRKIVALYDGGRIVEHRPFLAAAHSDRVLSFLPDFTNEYHFTQEGA